MKLRIKELGPIKHESEIELGDLTVFFGPPNTGKSTALKAIYYSLQSGGYGFERLGPSSFTNGVIDIAFEVKGHNVTLIFTPSNLLRKRNLPKGKFSLKPFSFSDFMLSHPLYVSKRRIDIPVTSFLSPGPECSKDEIEKIIGKIFDMKLVEAEVEVEENKATVSLSLDGLSERCSEALICSIINDVVNAVGRIMIDELREGFWIELSRLEGITDVVYLPYDSRGTHVRFLQNLTRGIRSFVRVGKEELSEWTEEQYMNAEIDEYYLKLLSPLLSGSLKYSKERGLEYVEGNEVIPWNQASDSVLEIVKLLLSLKNGSLVLYEEPETGLYEKLQVLMSLVLYALTNTNKLVITTHSQTILYTLAYVSFARPTADEVKEFLNSIGVKEGEELANLVGSASSKTVRFYYFHDGKVEEVDAKRIIEGIPDVVDIMHKTFEFTSKMYWRKELY